MNDKRPMNMSATRVSSYLTCRWKYWCTYVLRLPRKANNSFKLGIAVHDALAKAGEIAMKKDNFAAHDIRKIKEEYRKIAAREGIQSMDIYDDGLEMVLNRVDDFGVAPIKTIEDRFRVTTDDGVIIIGAMDKVVEMDEDTLVVIDYKTSKYVSNPAELKSDIQLSMYDLVASIKYPGYKRIILSLDYLRHEPVYTYRTVKERRTFAKYLASINEEMLKMTERHAKPALNDMCNWCDHKDNCDEYKNILLEKSIFRKNLTGFSDEELVKEYLNVKSRSRILYNFEKELKVHIIERIEEEGKDLTGEGKLLYIKQNRNMQYDPKTVSKVVPQKDFLNMINVGKKSLDEYLRDHPDIKPRVMETATKAYTTPFLAYRTLKGKK